MNVLADFYRKDEAALYVNPLEFHLMTDKQLAAHILAGVRIYNSMFPPDKGLNPLAILAVVVVAVAAVAAVAAAGTASAGSAAAASASATAAAPGVATVSATVGAPAASVASTVQSVAGYISKAGAVYSKATGKNPPDKLVAAADILGSGSASEAVKAGVNYQMKQEGLEIAKDDKNAQAALAVMAQREQEKYAKQLRLAAEQESKRLGVPITPAPEPLSARDWLPVAVPIALFLLGRG